MSCWQYLLYFNFFTILKIIKIIHAYSKKRRRKCKQYRGFRAQSCSLFPPVPLPRDNHCYQFSYNFPDISYASTNIHMFYFLIQWDTYCAQPSSACLLSLTIGSCTLSMSAPIHLLHLKNGCILFLRIDV